MRSNADARLVLSPGAEQVKVQSLPKYTVRLELMTRYNTEAEEIYWRSKLCFSIEVSSSLLRYRLCVMKLLGCMGVCSWFWFENWGQRMDSRQSCTKQSSPLGSCLLHKARRDRRGCRKSKERVLKYLKQGIDEQNDFSGGGHRSQWVDADAWFVAVHLKMLLHG